MIRALKFTSTSKMFFEAASKAYRYWLQVGPNARCVVQIRATELAKFRSSAEGLQVEKFVDILSMGGGWYEITEKAWAKPKFCNEGAVLSTLPSRGVALWVRALNLAYNNRVNANTYGYAIKVVPFGTCLSHKQNQNQNKPLPASPSKLAALAAKFCA